MKEIILRGKLANGKVAIVDDEDFEFLNRFKWSADADGYAVSAGYRYKMHRLITAATKKKVVDHINKNKLDNRKENLRLVTHKENSYNHSQKPGASGFLGVNRTHDGKSWEACISIKHKQLYLGTYKTKEEAALAYNKKAYLVRGEYAVLNLLQ